MSKAILLFIIIGSLALILGAVFLIKKSAKKFKLTDEQLKKIKERELEQLNKDKE